MESAAIESKEATLEELIAALRQEADRSSADQREAQILLAYMLSSAFGGDGPCSRSWH